MAELPKQLRAWIAKLVPQQKNGGAGAVQVGSVGGNVTSNVTIVNVLAPPLEAPKLASADQREVLALIRKLHNREAVFHWMQKSFGTRMVIDLKPSELLRTRRYVETIHRRLKREET